MSIGKEGDLMDIESFTVKKKNSELEYYIQLVTAFSFWSRFLGLMGKKSTSIGLIFNKTKQIHMFFMRFPLDIYFLDQQGYVIKIIRNIQPWEISPKVPEAYFVIEFYAGHETHLEIGDKLQMK